MRRTAHPGGEAWERRPAPGREPHGAPYRATDAEDRHPPILQDRPEPAIPPLSRAVLALRFPSSAELSAREEDEATGRDIQRAVAVLLKIPQNPGPARPRSAGGWICRSRTARQWRRPHRRPVRTAGSRTAAEPARRLV